MFSVKFMKKIFILLAVAAVVFAACSKEKEETNIAEKIIGKWMLEETNGHSVLTNEKFVYTFVSDTEGYVSASRVDFSEDHPIWTNYMPSEISIEGKEIIIRGNLNKTTSFVAELVIKSISDNEMLADSKYTVKHNGADIFTSTGTTLMTKVTTDYSSDILGVWEGRSTSADGSEFDDGEVHRWEYLDDDTYIYYALDADSNWAANVNEVSDYFVDGTLLCTRWLNVGEEVENREWWEIESIADGVMKWTALRKRDDGSFYTATFQMTKVQ